MYSSDQRIVITCDSQQVEKVIEFFLYMHSERPTREKLCYQIGPEGTMVIGWYGDKPDTGWTPFMFESMSTKLLAEIIKQHVRLNEPKNESICDTTEKGFLFTTLHEDWKNAKEWIKEPFYAIFIVKPYEIGYDQ